ncbi:MAG: sigma-54 dependent transcriptional regulator [Akkermansia sp.]|nr:sigma-54 dependent transcriptional regulator [Akkermansia sp.]
MKPVLLIVDDEKGTRQTLAAALEDSYEVFPAANAKGARAILDSEPVDLMLTDLRLGGESGMDLIDHARALPRPPQCIMMTAYGSPDTAAEAKRHGAYYFLNKPLNLDEVELLLKRASHTQELETANHELAARLNPNSGLDRLLGDSPQMQDIFNRIRRVAPTNATVLIQGETGTGKELAARAIHNLSTRGNAKFVPVNCAALSPQLMESELFGHEKGSFTGAVQRRIGRFEEADGGTIFLDEIGEIDIPTQVKLLRVLAEKSIERVGSNKSIPVDVRVLAATNRDLEAMVAAGTFRLDLYQRLNVISITLPPLRERREDIVLMANAFLKELGAENRKEGLHLTRPALDALTAYGWPGNVRQLRTAIEHGVVMCSGGEVTPADLPEYLHSRTQGGAKNRQKATAPDFVLDNHPTYNLKLLEQETIRRALLAVHGNRTEAAKLLGIDRRTLQRKMAQSSSH